MSEHPQPVLHATTDPGEKITLRPADMRDVDAILVTATDHETLEWVTLPLDYDRERAIGDVESYAPGWWERGDGAAWVVADADGSYVGQLDLRIDARDRQVADVGFMTAPHARGRGYMTAVLRAAVEFGFDELKLERIEWRAHVGEGSKRVAEKVGFIHEGTLRMGCPQRGARHDCWLAAILRSDLQAVDSRGGRRMTPDTITGDGVELRLWTMDDAEDLISACNDYEIARWLPLLPHPYTDESARWWIEQGAPAAWREGGAAFAIAFPRTRRILGGIGINSVQLGRQQAEVGYWIAPWARQQGVATRAARTISQWAFESGFHRLELLAAKENWVSQRVALNAGFLREGVRREGGPTRDGGRQDLVCFTRLATDPGKPIERLLPDFPGGHITDGIVRLRPLRTDDVDDFVALFQLPEVIETSFGPMVTPEVARSRAEQVQANWLAGERADCVIEDAMTGAFAGDIGLYYRDPKLSEAMIGYSLRPEFRGKGIATRAVNLLCEWAFENVPVVRIIAGTFPENRASQRVLERAGFTREGYLKAALPGRDGSRIDDIRFVRLRPNLGG